MHTDLAKKRGALSKINTRVSELTELIDQLDEALNRAPPGEVRAAASEELCNARRQRVRAEGGSDKLRSEIAHLEGTIRRWELLRSWSHGG